MFCGGEKKKLRASFIAGVLYTAAIIILIIHSGTKELILF